MHGRERDWRERRLERPTAVPRHPDAAAEQRLGGDRAEADEDVRPHDRELGLEPRLAGGDLGRVRPLVDPSLPTRLPLEVLDRVRQVGIRPLDPGFLERLVEEPSAGPTNGRPARSSRSPGCSPTSRSRDAFRPAPKTVCVPSRQSGHARQLCAASRSDASDSLGGRYSAAVPTAATYPRCAERSLAPLRRREGSPRPAGARGAGRGRPGPSARARFPAGRSGRARARGSRRRGGRSQAGGR